MFVFRIHLDGNKKA
ncbi:hypothetical protein [Escherichia coli]|nr:hypothetical protein [Escherichia coli]MBU3488335.1 hypothetical protein [Escherichia coli]MBW8499059.1 hypothetical protein [Escherichia coli]MCS0760559.1 hypothetical protein [Escherichia coli]MCS1077318.1 hypothetical protein [Escherichia coli]MDE7996492.1 hypothetical protein [Escherichia coli]